MSTGREYGNAAHNGKDYRAANRKSMNAKETVEVIRAITEIPLVRIVIRASVVLGCLYAYYNRLDGRDVYTLVTVILADAGLQAATKRE